MKELKGIEEAFLNVRKLKEELAVAEQELRKRINKCEVLRVALDIGLVKLKGR